jgi:hypothetical protein
MTTPPLSPAAEAVLMAQAKTGCIKQWVTCNDPPCHPADTDWNGCNLCIDRAGIAAAIRALVEQLARRDRTYMPYITPADILDIAAELDSGAPQPTSTETTNEHA